MARRSHEGRTRTALDLRIIRQISIIATPGLAALMSTGENLRPRLGAKGTKMKLQTSDVLAALDPTTICDAVRLAHDGIETDAIPDFFALSGGQEGGYCR
jgi:hypothetical protein